MAEASATELARRATERLRLPPHSVEAEQSLLGAAWYGQGLRLLDGLNPPAGPRFKPDLKDWENYDLAACWIGHATVLLRINGTTILTDPVMSGFVAGLDLMNTLADASPGFVWRLQDDSGNATGITPYDDEMVIPPSTVMIENPVAIVDENVDKHCVREVAEAFVEFLHSDTAKELYATVGYLRPTDLEAAQKGDEANGFPPVEDLFTVEDLGGWDGLADEVFAEPAGLRGFGAEPPTVSSSGASSCSRSPRRPSRRCRRSSGCGSTGSSRRSGRSPATPTRPTARSCSRPRLIPCIWRSAPAATCSTSTSTAEPSGASRTSPAARRAPPPGSPTRWSRAHRGRRGSVGTTRAGGGTASPSARCRRRTR